MARRPKLDACAAKRLLRSEGIRFDVNVYTLPVSDLSRVAEVAKKAGYRKSKNAPGSTGRMYFEYLSRLKGCGADLGRAKRGGLRGLGLGSGSTKPKSRGSYVQIDGKLYRAGSAGAQKAMAAAGRLMVPIARWDGFDWSDTGMVLHRKGR